MARPKRDDLTARSAHVAARFTAAERLALDERATSAGVTLSEFVRASALGVTPARLSAAMPAGPAGVLSADELRELNAIGNNLNQIARALNSGRADPVDGDLRAALSQLETVWDRYLP